MATPIYPAPTLVLGIGRFGLATLERLGEDWLSLSLSGGDASLNNLRLVWVHADDDQDPCWRRRERASVTIAGYVDHGDLPSLVVDFAILRSLGLIRYFHGTYQVAIPRDAGVVVRRASAAGASEAEGEAGDGRILRRRFFEWQGLCPDPIASAELLKRQIQSSAELDLFVAPIISRVRQGHSPRSVIACIARCRVLAEGRDPSPWRWLHGLPPERREPGAALQVPEAEIRRHLRPDDDHLESFAPEPIEGWAEWRAHRQAGGDPVEKMLGLRIPPRFVPTAEDPISPLELGDLLKVDWEKTGWASEELEDEDSVYFTPTEASTFRLGLFDHESDHGTAAATDAALGKRLVETARYLHQGLVRLWVDLQRERVEESVPIPGVRRRQQYDLALHQSLEVLGGLLVRPLVKKEATRPEHQPVADPPLPAEPSGLLAALTLPPQRVTAGAEQALARRLAALGLDDGGAPAEPEKHLLRTIALNSSELGDPEATGAAAGPGHSGEDNSRGSEPEILQALREVLNQEVRELVDFSFLTSYRERPTRQPPRLTVLVVGDMAEPFTRVSTCALLRVVHAELLRSFSPMFELHREGFDRTLSILPILWMPHPSDPFGGAPPAATRTEEAAIIEAVHKVRRWVESVLPAARRRVSQIFINGRVTDTSVLSPSDAVRQTRDFISFLIRTDVSREDWLRRTAVGPGGNDFFSSFACYEIEFPAERAREYLANRLARHCLRELRESTSEARPTSTDFDQLKPPGAEELSAGSTEQLIGLTHGAADQIRRMVSRHLQVTRRTSAREILDRFDDSFEGEVWRRVDEHWRELADRRGRMDELIDDLRRATSDKLVKTLGKIRAASDRRIESAAGAAGLNSALAYLNRLRSRARERLRDAESSRQARERLARHHQIPARAPLARACREVCEAADKKPDLNPMLLATLIWLLMGPALGAPILLSLAVSWGLADSTLLGWLEVLMGPWAPLTGAVLLTFGVFAALQWHLGRCVERVRKAIAGMAEASARIVEGSSGEPSLADEPSIHSFLATRLRLTEALALRAYTAKVYEQVLTDHRLAHRLNRSLDVQDHLLSHRAEILGVRPAMVVGADEDDVGNLFACHTGERVDKLIDPRSLHEYFRRSIRREDTLPVTRFLAAGGGFGNWRKQACLCNTERVMDFGRTEFDTITCEPITEQDFFADEVAERLCRFVDGCYSNMGFGAKFLGYEGLDPDGVRLAADAALVVDEPLRRIYEEGCRKRQQEAEKRHGRRHPAAPPTRIRTLSVLVHRVRQNAAYMLSLVQGIRAHSVRNLKRFESFHDRPEMPDDHGFPLLQSSRAGGSGETISHLTGRDEWSDELYAKVRKPEPEETGEAGEDPAPKEPSEE